MLTVEKMSALNTAIAILTFKWNPSRLYHFDLSNHSPSCDFTLPNYFLPLMIYRPIYYHNDWKQNPTHHQRSSSYFQNWIFARFPWREYLPLSACVPNQTGRPHSRSGSTVPGARCWDGVSGLDSWKAGGLCTSYPGRYYDSGWSLGVVLCWHCGPRFGWHSYLMVVPSDTRSQGKVRTRAP